MLLILNVLIEIDIVDIYAIAYSDTLAFIAKTETTLKTLKTDK
jgi:hypothetical protein